MSMESFMSEQSPDLEAEAEAGPEIETYATKVESADREIAESFRGRREAVKKTLEEQPVFESKKGVFEIRHEQDYMIAETQQKLSIAREMLEEARGRDERYEEKAAFKLVSFFENKLGFLRIYAAETDEDSELSEILRDEINETEKEQARRCLAEIYRRK